MRSSREALLISEQSRYWVRNRRLVVLFLVIWAVVTFGVAFFARELSSIDFLGWPFPYWVGAQGALILYLLITIVFAVVMNRLDSRLRHRRRGAR